MQKLTHENVNVNTSYHAIKSAWWWKSRDVKLWTVLLIVFTDDVIRDSQNLISPFTLDNNVKSCTEVFI